MLTFVFKQEFGSAGIENGKGCKKVTEFTHYFQHVVFTPYGKSGKRKELSNYIRFRLLYQRKVHFMVQFKVQLKVHSLSKP
jgi:hypothetical protein